MPAEQIARKPLIVADPMQRQRPRLPDRGNGALFAEQDFVGCNGLGLAPILMRRDEVINLKTAMHVAGRSERTIRGWCKVYGIGVQPFAGSPLEISAPALEMLRHGDAVALELLREGNRHHPRVKRFFDFLGIVA